MKYGQFDNLHDYMQYNLHEYGPFHPSSKPKDRQLLKGLHFKFSEQNPKILEKLINAHDRLIVTRGSHDFRYGSGSIDIGDAITRIRDTKLGFVNRPFHNW